MSFPAEVKWISVSHRRQEPLLKMVGKVPIGIQMNRYRDVWEVQQNTCQFVKKLLQKYRGSDEDEKQTHSLKDIFQQSQLY